MKFLIPLLLLISCTKDMQYSQYNNISGYTLDAEGLAFIAAAEITDAVQKTAIANLVGELKTNSLYAKMKAVYPIIGGTAASHKWNLINPLDSDAAFRLTFGGTLTHNANGIKGSADGYINSHCVPADDLTTNDFHISGYCTENKIQQGALFGCSDASTTIQFLPRDTYQTSSLIVDRNNSIRVIYNNDNSIGFWAVSDITSLDANYPKIFTVYCDGIHVANKTGDTDLLPSTELHFLSKGTATTPNTNYDNTLRFATFGDALTQDEQFILNGIVHRFQTALGRANPVIRETDYTVSADLFTIQDAGTFAPATAINARLAEWNNLKVGALICFNLEGFSKNITSSFLNIGASTEMICPTVPVQSWVDGMKNADIKYACLTIQTERGYSLIDQPFGFNNTLEELIGGARKFDVGQSPSMYKNTWDDFVYMCRQSGIEPIPYICPSVNYNLYYLLISNWVSADVTTAWTNYCCKQLQWLIQTYSLKYVWLDMYFSSAVNAQDLYDAVKAIDPNCLVISNIQGDINYAKRPYDIGSNEEVFSFDPPIAGNTDAKVFGKSRTDGITTFYIPQEGNLNVIEGSGTWFYKGEAVVPRSQESTQDYYDRCKAYDSNFNMGLIPDRDGVISQAQFDLFKNLVR